MPTLTRPARRGQAERDKRRDTVERRVLEAVDRLLQQGFLYTEVAVQRIAAEADIARSTFYRYFPDKSQLLIRIAELATADQFAAAERWWSRGHADGADGVTAAMRTMIAASRAHHRVLRALVEVASYDRDVAEYWYTRLRRFTELVELRLVRDQADHHLDSDLDPAATALVLTAMVERSIGLHFAGASAVDDDHLAQTLGHAIWRVISPS